MRDVSAPELAILTGQRQNDYLRLEIKNASGTWKDFTSLAGKDYLVGFRASTDVDSPVWSMQAQLKRDGEVSTESLAPLRGDSTLNVDDSAAYAPAINAAREWRVLAAVTADGVSVAGGDWKELCAGYLDKPDFTADPMTVEGRSVGARLMDSTIRVKRTYSGAFEDVAQQIVTDNLPSPAPTLYIPSPPDFTVTEFIPFQVSVMDALVTLALSTGWMVRDVYDPGDGVMKTGIIDPQRDKASADVTVTPIIYLTVDGASLDVANVRNVIEGEYIDGVTGEVGTVTVTDPASIAAFGNIERYMKFSEDATSPINSGNEMLDMVTAALTDLSTPKFDHVVTSTFFWPSEITDLIDFTGNAVHYDTTQRLALFGIVHEFANGHATTQWTCRGTPAGAFLEWIRRQGDGPTGPAIPPAPQIDFVLGEADSYGSEWFDDFAAYDGGVWIGGRLNAGCASMIVFAELADGEGFSVDETSSTTAVEFRRPDGTEGTDPNFAFLIRLTTRYGFFKRIKVVGRSASNISSRENIWPVAVQAVDPIPTPADGTLASVSVTADVTKTSYAVTVTPSFVDTTFTDNWLTITRDGVVVFRQNIGTDLSPVTFLDTGVTPSPHQWDAFIWNNGVSGPKNRWVEQTPPLGDAPQFTVPPVARVIGGAVQVYMEGVTGLAGADRMAAVKSLDQRNTTTFGISSGLTPFIATDTATGPKWYKLIAYSATDVDIYAESPWLWWNGLQPTGSTGANPPVFVNGTPKKVQSGGGTGGTALLTVLLIQWTATTSGAANISVQRSDDNGLSDPWLEVVKDANVGSGTYQSLALVNTDAWYRLVALDDDGDLIAASAGVHYIP